MRAIKVGSRVRDRITGCEGVAVARTVWQHGCPRITVQPELLRDDGTPVDTVVFDEPQVEAVCGESRGAGFRAES